MDQRALERAFARAHGGGLQRAAGAASAQAEAPQGDSQQQQQRPDDQPETAEAAIQRILKHWSEKEYFLLLQLPQPIADELGKPTWPCTASDVSKAYRRLSVLVHPDKHPGSDARAAFEALNETHRMLKDPSRLEQVLKDVSGRALKERDRLDARAAAESGHAAMAAARNEAVQRLRKQQGAAFGQEILAQVKARQEEAARRAAAVAKARVTTLHQQDEHQGEEDEEGKQQQQQQRAAGHKRAARNAGGDGGAEDPDDDSDDEDGATRRKAMAARAAGRKRKMPTILH